jgi:methyl-accepting chemotaxis protein
MFKKWNLTQKVIVSISAVLIMTSLLSLWITRERVNRQAEEAFRDKVRQITGMATATREWYSANLDKLVPNREFKSASEVAQNIQGVAEAAQSTSHGATDSQKAAKSLAQMSTHLRGLVGRSKLEEKRDAGPKRSGNSQPPATKSEQHEEEFATK